MPLNPARPGAARMRRSSLGAAMIATLASVATFVAAILVLIVGFGFHFLGQLISVINWELACRLGLQERDVPEGFYAYEYGQAVGDVLMAWIYPLAALGLLLGADWGYQLAWIPGAILTYHALSAWFWEVGRRSIGHGIWSDRFRLVWCSANFGTGILTLAVAWAGTA